MPNQDGTSLTVTVYEGLDQESVDNPNIFEGVDYVSLVSDETYGPPALVAPAKGEQRPRAQVGDRVLYLNTRFVPAWEIERVRA